MYDKKWEITRYNLNKEILTMDKILGFMQAILMIKKDDGIKVGLTQFKVEDIQPIKKDVSIRTKDVKLSDLMRRVS